MGDCAVSLQCKIDSRILLDSDFNLEELLNALSIDLFLNSDKHF